MSSSELMGRLILYVVSSSLLLVCSFWTAPCPLPQLPRYFTWEWTQGCVSLEHPRIHADVPFSYLPVYTFSISRPAGSGSCSPCSHGAPSLFWRWAASGRVLRLSFCSCTSCSRLRRQLCQVAQFLSTAWVAWWELYLVGDSVLSP